MPKRAVLVLLFLCLTPMLVWAQAPLGPEFAVNAHTTGWQSAPTVALQANGNFVVVWQGPGPGDGYGVFARRFAPSGVAIEPADIPINSPDAGIQRMPSIATDADGRLVVVWRNDNGDFSDYDVIARQFDAAGTGGTEFRVNTYTPGHHGPGSVALRTNGDFVVVWASPQEGNDRGVVGQHFNAAGVRQLGEFQVNSYTTGTQYWPSVAPLPDGGFIVVWTSDGQDGAGTGVFGQRYGSSGFPQGSEFPVNSSTAGTQWNPKVAADASGRFVAVWSTFGQGAIGDGLFGRLYDPSGTPGSEFAISAASGSFVNHPSVAKDANGDFVAVWTSMTGDVYGRRYDASGTPDGPEFQVNSYTPGDQKYPSVAFGANGTFVVVWTSYQDGDGRGIVGRRFARDPIFMDGFESGDMSAWSAAATDGRDLSVSEVAALNRTFAGLQADVNDTAGLYVQDNSPNDEGRYRARFYFDTNGFDPGETEAHRRTRIFLVFQEAPLRRLAAIVLRRINGEYSLRGRARLDDNTQYDTPFETIREGAHVVELDWKRASGPDANDGSFALWIDGTSVHSIDTLDNSISGVDFVRLGALSVKTGASGTLYWDEFESRRATYIGP